MNYSMPKKLPEFSPEGYRQVLKNAINNEFEFFTFYEKQEAEATKRRSCLLRHDIDTSLKCALEMAQIEYSLNIKSTYFLMLRSPAYNLFSRYAHDVISKLTSLGHEIALHFDAAHPAAMTKDLCEVVREESEILSQLCRRQIVSVSFHQPSKSILEGNLEIPGLTNTYNKKQMQGWYYSSDSNRVWKEHNALTLFEQRDHLKVQILIHPIWWMYSDENIEDAWDSAIKDNFKIMQQQFLDTEGAYGPERTFKINR